MVVARNREEAQLVTDESKFDFTEASYKNALDSQEGRVRKINADIEVPPAALDHSLDKGVADDKREKLGAPDSVLIPGERDDPAKDFQLQRALDVLRFGGVRPAEAARPSAVFQPPKAVFALNTPPTPSAAQRVRAGRVDTLPEQGGASSATLKPGAPAEKSATPPEQVAPSGSAPAIPK